MLQLLCQVNFDDWFEIAVIALVVIGGAIANAVKSLAAKKEERQAQARPPAPPEARPPRQIRNEPPELSPREQTQLPPIAPPIPTMELRPETQGELERLRRRAHERQTGGQFVPPPPVAPTPPRMPADGNEARRVAAEHARRIAAEQSRRAAAEAAQRTEQRRRERAEHERREAAKREAAQRKSAPRGEGERLSMASESLDEREIRLTKQRDKRLGHVGEGVVAPEHEVHASAEGEDRAHASAPGPPVEGAARRLPPLTRNSLRDAIVLNEILSPPLSIRPNDDLAL